MTEEELRLTSDTFLAHVERLNALEVQKRELPPAQTAGLAREVEALAAEVLGWAKRQTSLASRAATESPRGRPIAVTGPRAISVVLDEWRAAERRLSEAQPGTAEWASISSDVDRLRDEYARAHQALAERTS
jgi:hypothetical protein